MSLSSTALKQREKEAKALRSFLIYSSIGSFVLHIGLLTLFLGYFLIKIPQVKDEPIELTLIEVPNQEVKKLPEIEKSPLKVDAGGGGGGGGGKFAQQQTSTGADTSSTSVVKQPNIQPSQQLLPQTPVITSPIQKLAETSKTTPPQPTTPETSKPVVTQPPITNEPPLEPNSSTTKLVERLKSPPPQPTIPTAPSNSIPLVPASPSPTSINAQSNGTQRSLTSSQTPGILTTNGSGNPTNNAFSNGSGNGSGNGVGNGSGDGVGNGSGDGVGNGVGNGSGNGVGNGSGDGVGNQPKKEEVATAPKPPTDKGSFLDRADCIKCDYKYPDRARRLGIQGNAKMALNADENGNVTSVKLIDSTGDRELDEAAQTSAREWKLKPRDGGRQGVLAVIKYSVKKPR